MENYLHIVFLLSSQKCQNQHLSPTPFLYYLVNSPYYSYLNRIDPDRSHSLLGLPPFHARVAQDLPVPARPNATSLFPGVHQLLLLSPGFEEGNEAEEKVWRRGGWWGAASETSFPSPQPLSR